MSASCLKTLILIVVASSQILTPVFTKAPKQPCHVMSSVENTVTLKCRRAYELFDPTVTTSLTRNGQCGGRKICSGQQVNGMILAHKCHWQRRCEIRYSNLSVMVMSESMLCIAKHPHILETSHRCVKSVEVFQVGNVSQTIQSKQGVLKSHNKYPWHCPRGMIGSIVLRAPGRMSTLRLTVHDADIDWDEDSINIIDGSGGVIAVNASSREFSLPGLVATVSFDNTGISSMVAKGFVICFKWFPNNANTSGNICESVCRRSRTRRRNTPKTKTRSSCNGRSRSRRCRQQGRRRNRRT